MTARQTKVLDAMACAMGTRFAENEWRERMPFPSIHELAARAMACASQAYRNSLIGSNTDALRHAADAANLLGLMVICGDEPRVEKQ